MTGLILKYNNLILPISTYIPSEQEDSIPSGLVQYSVPAYELPTGMEWGLINNATFQSSGGNVSDGDVDYITAEYAKTYVVV